MTTKEFTYRLNAASEKLFDFVQSYITNTLNTSVILYRIEANDKRSSDHLNDFEKQHLQKVNSVENQLFKSDEVATILCVDDKIPLWINIEIYKSTKQKTIISLICSRRYVVESALNTELVSFPPFDAAISLPPWRKEDEKFDVNWKHHTWKRKWYQFIWRFCS